MVATITVNSSRNNGSIEGGRSSEESQILRQILQEIQKANRTNYVSGRKSESTGFLNAAAGGGLLSKISPYISAAIGTAGTAAASIYGGLTSMTPSLNNDFSSQFGGYKYSQAQGEGGQKVYFEIDQKTQEIVDVLDERQAKEKGILDSQGNLFESIKTSEKIEQTIFKNKEKQNGFIQLTNSEIRNIIKSLDNQGRQNKEIEELNRLYIEALKKRNQKMNAEKSADTIVSSNISNKYSNTNIQNSIFSNVYEQNMVDDLKEANRNSPLFVNDLLIDSWRRKVIR